ncbi:MAG: hypothetical protein D3M94_14795 [Rhodocyclales bacterium GT-UBC]|nr:MAG: hypothetical protein D3M94_14795 [Rhodocyclales bacterium GT-UBC]
MQTLPKFSVIVCSVEAAKFAHLSASLAHLLGEYPHEIIGIHDAKSLAEGYNRGLANSTGDIIIFSHDDILFADPHFARKIADRMQSYDILGFAGTSKLITATWFGAGQPHIHGAICHAKRNRPDLSLNIYGAATWPVVEGIQAIDGCCMIVKRVVAEAIGFDAETFDGFHLYDLDFSYSAYRAGYRLGVCCDIPILHESSGNFAYQHLQYAERFVLKYIAELGNTNPQDIVSDPPGRGAGFSDYGTLLRAWNEQTLQRATIAMRRSFRG